MSSASNSNGPMNFAHPEVDWRHIGKSLSRVCLALLAQCVIRNKRQNTNGHIFLKTPQLLRNRLHLDQPNTSTSTNIDGVTVAQLAHAKEITARFQSLDASINRYMVSMGHHILHMKEVFRCLQLILGNEEMASRIDVFDVVKHIHHDLDQRSSDFRERVGAILSPLLEIQHAVQRTVKEREYLDLDHLKCVTACQRCRPHTQALDVGKKYENDNNLETVKQKALRFDRLLSRELPLFFIYSAQIAELLSVMLFYYSHDSYQIMYSHFKTTQAYLGHGQMDNIYFQNYAQHVKALQQEVASQIEALQLFTSTHSRLYNVEPGLTAAGAGGLVAAPPPAARTGVALYPFAGQAEHDLKFSRGDIVHVLEEHPSGWWKGTIGSSAQCGTFPCNYFTFS